MSDPSDVLGPALVAWWRADSDVIAAFGANVVQVLDNIPQPNTPFPHAFLEGLDVDDSLEVECLEATEVFINLGVYSLPPNGSKAEIRRLNKAFRKSLKRMESGVGNSPEFTLAGYRVVGVYGIRTQVLVDPSDNKTLHGVINATLSVDPT